MKIDSMQDELDYPDSYKDYKSLNHYKSIKNKMISTKEAKKIMRESKYVPPPKPYIVAAYDSIPRKRKPMTKLDRAQENYDKMTDPFYETINLCPNCAEELIGDGVTVVMHCPFADEDDYFDHEPDADPVYCKEDFNAK